MTSANWCYTVAEILDYLDDNFNLSDDGVNSDIERLDGEDFHEESNMLPEVAISEDDEDVNLAALDIKENSDQDIASVRHHHGHLCLHKAMY